jgi:hypothetical protein
MSRIPVCLFLVAISACRSGRAPDVRLQDVVAADDAVWGGKLPQLRGNWIGGSGTEPTGRVLTSEAQCLRHPAAWALEARGDSVLSYHFPESFDQGIARREPVARIAPAIGRIRSDTVFLVDQGDRYALRYDSTSGHLRGTRNGQPFWAVETQELHRERCPPPPR